MYSAERGVDSLGEPYAKRDAVDSPSSSLRRQMEAPLFVPTLLLYFPYADPPTTATCRKGSFIQLADME